MMLIVGITIWGSSFVSGESPTEVQQPFFDKSRPSEPGQPTRVYVGIFVVDLDSIDTANQSFEANVYLQLQWNDPQLKHDREGPISVPLEDVWNPRAQIINQQRTWPTFPEEVSISPDGEVTYRQRVWGSFSQPLRLRDFPFDKHSFSIQIASIGYRANEVQLLNEPAGKSGIAELLSIADWQIVGWENRPVPYEPLPGGPKLPGFAFTFHAERLSEYFIVKVILPLVLIVSMSWVVFWLDPMQVGSNVGISITSMLTLIAYRFAIDSSLPKVPYLTRLDYFILASTILVFLSLNQALISSILAKKGHIRLARKLDVYSRVVFPLVFVLIAIETLVLRWVL